MAVTTRRSRRRTTRRRRFTRRRRGGFIATRNPGMVMTRRLSDGTIYKFKRTIYDGSIAGGGVLGTPVFGAYNFALTDLTNFTEFTTLYDSFRIVGVKLMFVPKITENSNPAINHGQFMYVPDYDDDTVPVNILEILERQSNKVKQIPGRPFKIFLRPKAQVNTTVSGGAQLKGNWLKCSTSTATPHYGLKWAWQNSNSSITLDVYMTFYLKFKGVK